MSRHEPLGGDTHEAGAAQEGNRPAQNARLSTPGSLSTQGYQGGSSAGDFLGLDAEVAANASAGSLMAQAAAASAPQAPAEPEPSAWVETEHVRERAAEAYEAAYEEGEDEGGDETAAEYEVHASWSESAPKRGGAGKLVGAAAGLVVLGLLGVAGMKFMGATAEDAPGEPLASRPTPPPTQAASLAGPSEVEDESGNARAAIGADPASSAAAVVEESGALAGAEQTALDPEHAREAFEATRGDEPPVWFDPNLDSQGEPAQTGWSEEAEAVTRASTFIGDPVALLVAGVDTTTSAESAAEPETTPAPAAATDDDAVAAASVSGVTTLVVDAKGAAESLAPLDGAPEAAASEEATASAATTTIVATTVQPTPPAGAGAPASEVAGASAAGAATVGGAAVAAAVGPEAPADAGALLSGDGAVAAFNESRQSRTSALKVEDVLLAPTMDSSNLRKADAKDLSGVWEEASVPMQALASKTKVLTPNVGRVRVVLTSKDIFEGRLYAVGQGSVWLESEYGKISVDGKRIASVAQIDTKEGTPPLGAPGSQNLNGLEKVRVKTPGGTFYGKVIARDDKQTTLITEDGARLTLASGDVEFLTDAPKVSIGGKLEDAPKKQDGAKQP